MGFLNIAKFKLEALRYRCSFERNPDLSSQARLYSGRMGRQIVRFDPMLVMWCLDKFSVKDSRFCIPGDWDKEKVSKIDVARAAIVETVDIMFLRGGCYKDTPQYQIMRDAVLSKHASPKEIGAYWCRDLADVDVYFNRLKETYRKISNEGFKSQLELARESPELVQKKQDEIKLYVGRSGTLLLGGGGTHRICIAKILGFKDVPGLICGVHYDWAARKYTESSQARFDIAISAALSEEFLTRDQAFVC